MNTLSLYQFLLYERNFEIFDALEYSVAFGLACERSVRNNLSHLFEH